MAKHGQQMAQNGQPLVKTWSSMAKHGQKMAQTGQAPVKPWSNNGQTW